MTTRDEEGGVPSVTIPPRSMLFLPADKPRMAAKVPQIDADLAVLDLEDAVAAEAKVAARSVLRESLADGLVLDSRSVVLVRVNEVGSPWFEDDLALVRELRGLGPVGVVVPKVEAADDVTRVRDVLGDGPLVAGIESGLGVLDVRAILAAGPDGCYFGAEDYIVDLGGRRTAGGAEVLYARSQVVLAASVSGVFAIDQAVVAVRDDDAFSADAAQGRDLGYAGKICLHPRQVELAHQVFTPTPAELEHARRVLAAAAAAGGVGVVDGVMVDHVHVRQAQALLERAPQ
jgi:citrate lyase subunit beta/citryl-CoA lyase